MLQQGLGTLDSKIDQKAGALRSNPQAMGQLQQQQKTQLGKGITPDLMDALAAQKVLSEKTLANNQLKLSQEQNPATVAEQYEQQLVAMNKDELTAQTAGIMGERNKKRQQQTSAAKPPQPQGQRPPMAQGAPQGLPAAPRPPMQMAQGGIIGYKKGDKVSAVEAKGSRMEEALKALGMTYKEYKALSQQEKNAIRPYIQREYKKQREAYEVPEMPISKVMRERKAKEDSKKQSATKKIEDRLGIKPEDRVGFKQKETSAGGLGTITDPKTGQGFNAAPEEYIKRMKDTEVDPSVIVKNPFTAQPVGDPTVGDPTVGDPTVGDPNVAGQPPALDVDQQLQEIINTPATDYTTISKKQATEAMGSKFNTQLDKRMAVDPEAKKQAETETLSGPSQTPVLDAEGKPVIGPDGKPVMKATGGYDRQGKAEGLAKYLKQKEDLDKAALDPDAVAKRRNQAYIDGLITGGTGRTGTAARSQFDTNIAKSKQASISEQKAMYMEDMKFDTEIADKISTQANKVFEVYTDDVAKAMDTAATVGIANLDMFYKEAKMAYDSNQDGIKNKIDAIKTSTAANLQELIQSQATMQEISSAAINLTAEIGKLKENFYSTLSAEKLGIERELNKKETTPTRRKQLLAQLDEYELRFAAQKEILEADAFMQILKTMMEESGRNNGFSSKTKQQVQQIVKTSTGTSQQQTTGLANARQQAILEKQATTKYVPTD